MDPYALLMDIWPLLTHDQQAELLEIASKLAQYAPHPQPQDDERAGSDKTDAD